MNYLIEESACKEDERTDRLPMSHPLWRWLEREGPIIVADGRLNETTGNVAFSSPFGRFSIPEDVVSEMDDE